ncbi:DNA repair protein rad50 [Rhynchophorus ferrugineus]|uniref:DNA repair protein rad50 n=1 Tax=Rhynchophorus ferrugineus TaxID=354439 RepID=UPI003FCD801D
MALLEKLSICGIRSFGPSTEEKIKFSTPLTLILGQNGCGKTTIIECLKFALTGDVPSGTGTGAGFVNDPNLSNRRSTKCSVKVKFKDCRGDYITIGKFAEVSLQGEKQMKFKSISPSVRWEESSGNGHIEDISSRCADINSYCSQKLNVSKAMLNNVIFCHQENSAWPLDEGKKLKEKFDEIFGSSEYNKCVDKVRKIIQTKTNNLKVLKEQLAHKDTIKNNVEQLQKSILLKSEQLSLIETFIKEKHKHLQPLQNRINEICKLEDEYNIICQDLAGLQKTYEALITRNEDLTKYIKIEYKGSDEELDNEIKNFNKNQENTKKHITEMEQKKNVLESKVKNCDEDLKQLNVDCSKIMWEKDLYNKALEKLNDLIEKSRVKFKVIAESDETHSEAVDKLKNVLSSEKFNLEKLQENNEITEREKQEDIDKIREKLAATKHDLKSKKEAIIQHQRKINEYNQKINNLAYSAQQLKEANKKINELEADLASIKSDFNEFEFQLEIDRLESQLSEREEHCKKLDREYEMLKQNRVIEHSIEKEKNLIIAKKAEIEEIRQRCDDDFKLLFASDMPKTNFQQSVKNIQCEQDKKLIEINECISKSEKELSSLETEVKNTKDTLREFKNQLKINIDKIEDQCKGKPFSQVLKQTYQKKEELQNETGAYRSEITLFDKYITKFQQESPCCPVCQTNFSQNRFAVPKIIQRLQQEIELLPSKLDQTETELKQEEEAYNKLQQLKPINDEISILQKTKIPDLQLKLQNQEENLNEKRVELAASREDKKNPMKLLEASKKVLSDVVVLDRLINEINCSEELLVNLENKLIKVSSNRTLNQTELELRKVKVELDDIRGMLKSKKNNFDMSKDHIQRVEKSLQVEKQKKANIESGTKEQPWLEKEIKNYSQNISDLEMEVHDLEDAIQCRFGELQNAEKVKAEIVTNNKIKLETMRTKIEDYGKNLNDISKLVNEVVYYEKSINSNNLQDILKKIDQKKSDIDKLQQAKKMLETKIAEKHQEEANQISKMRSLTDNQELRKNRKKGMELKNQIDELNGKIKGIGSNKSIVDEKIKLEGEISSLEREINVKIGEQERIKDDIEEKQKEVNKKENREAFEQHRYKFYEVQIEQLSITDLDRYVKVLENSILKFHQQKMEYINRTIRDLWRNIYKGNDIDYIEIQADGNVGGSKRRNYSYKVVQVKRGVELEMRGRCSAGQKVLSCLVIRIALAETFSTHCGILALDEPTTNLDRENIDSLCDALSNIITSRQTNSSFQLLIITHDEEFIRTLTRNQSVSHYYRVYRNTDGFSQIKREIL